MDKTLMESVKQVEDSCSWFLKEHPNEGEIEKNARGLGIVARALRALMIVLEQEDPSRGILQMPIYEHTTECGDHEHITAIFFTSKGEFYPGVGLKLDHTPSFGHIFNRRLTPSEIIRAGIPARALVEGINKAMHSLVMGKSATMPMAQA